MGIFGSSTRITVFSQAMQLMQVSDNPTQEAVLYALFSGESIGATIVNTYLQGMGVKVDAAMSYARSTYTLGLPDGTFNFFPVVPIRYNNSFVNEVDNPDLYKTGKQLLHRMGVDMDDLTSNLDSNPDIAEIDHAYVMFGVDLQTDNNIALGYLVEFFSSLSGSNSYSVWDALTKDIEPEDNIYPFGDTPTSEITLTEYGLDIAIRYDMCVSYLVTGSIGEIGTATKEITEYAVDTIVGTGENATHTMVYHNTLTLRKQVTNTKYKEVKVYDLKHENMIYGNYSVLTTSADVLADPDEHNLLIPIRMETVRDLSLKDKDILYREAFMLVITGYVKTKVKWYQSSLFKMVLMVAAVVISITSGQAWVVGLVEAASWGAMVLTVYLLTSVVIMAATHYATAYIAKEVGPEWAMVVAVVSMLVAKKMKFNMEFGVGELDVAIPSAELFMGFGAKMVDASMGEITRQIEEVKQESDDFTAYTEAKWETLEDVQKSMNLTDFSYLDLDLKSMQPAPDTLTNAHEFYADTHVQNAGTLCLRVIENYVDIALKLPKPESIT